MLSVLLKKVSVMDKNSLSFASQTKIAYFYFTKPNKVFREPREVTLSVPDSKTYFFSKVKQCKVWNLVRVHNDWLSKKHVFPLQMEVVVKLVSPMNSSRQKSTKIIFPVLQRTRPVETRAGTKNSARIQERVFWLLYTSSFGSSFGSSTLVCMWGFGVGRRLLRSSNSNPTSETILL